MLEEIVKKEYYPPSKEVIIYIDSLPEYAKYQGAMNVLPSDGSYRLPVQEAGRQLGLLMQQFSENFHVNKNKPDYEIPADFFKTLPGVKNVKFQTMTVSYLNGRHRSFGGRNLLTVTLPSQQEEFVISNLLVFENSVEGGIAAFVMATTLNQFISWWHALYGCDHSFIPYRHSIGRNLGYRVSASKAKFASAFSSCNPIPYGFRMEMLEQNHYLVRALAQTPTDGLVDFTVEMKDGKLITLSGIVVQKPTCQMLY